MKASDPYQQAEHHLAGNATMLIKKPNARMHPSRNQHKIVRHDPHDACLFIRKSRLG